MVPEHVPSDVLCDIGAFRRRSDVIPLDGFGPKWLPTFHALTGKNPVLISGIGVSDADERSAAEECVLTTHPGAKYSQSSDNRKNFFSHIL